MTLRSRVIFIVTALVVVGIALASVLAYGSTRRELVRETDRFLEQRSGELLDGQRQPPKRDGQSGGPTELRNDPAGPTGDIRLSVDPDALTQTIDRNGDIIAASGDPLPVGTDEEAVAAGAAPEIRDVIVDGTPYRMITVHDRGGGAVQVARSTAAADTVLDGLRLRFTLLGTAVALLAAILGWLLMRRATRPLEDLTVAAERVAETNELVPLDLRRHDEVGRLANSFDRMLDALAVSREQQRRLVQDAGHELRTPLTSLRANIELLQRAHDLPDDQLDDLLRGLNAEVVELSDLFTELIELATDAHDDDPDVETDLATVVDDAVDRFRRRTGREVTIVTESTPLVGQPVMLTRAVNNLLANAHKFSPPGEQIDVELSGHRVTVRDHGPGVGEADQVLVFDRFYRAATARGQAGSGLGLAIVRQIAERHGGTVVVGTAPGGGAEVGFTVGVGRPGAAPDTDQLV